MNNVQEYMWQMKLAINECNRRTNELFDQMQTALDEVKDAQLRSQKAEAQLQALRTVKIRKHPGTASSTTRYFVELTQPLNHSQAVTMGELDINISTWLITISYYDYKSRTTLTVPISITDVMELGERVREMLLRYDLYLD